MDKTHITKEKLMFDEYLLFLRDADIYLSNVDLLNEMEDYYLTLLFVSYYTDLLDDVDRDNFAEVFNIISDISLHEIIYKDKLIDINQWNYIEKAYYRLVNNIHSKVDNTIPSLVEKLKAFIDLLEIAIGDVNLEEMVNTLIATESMKDIPVIKEFLASIPKEEKEKIDDEVKNNADIQ